LEMCKGKIIGGFYDKTTFEEKYEQL